MNRTSPGMRYAKQVMTIEVQDLLKSELRRRCRLLHASTQMTIYDINGAKVLKNGL